MSSMHLPVRGGGVQQATAAAASKREDAQAKLGAAGKRAQADRVEQLADAEKRKRQAERANNTRA
jgi:hypothetical protein